MKVRKRKLKKRPIRILILILGVIIYFVLNRNVMLDS